MKNGEIWAVDITGAQYGYPETLFPWSDNQRDRIGKINGQWAFGHFRRRIAQSFLESPLRLIIARRIVGGKPDQSSG
jgi:hypothetical protein